MKASLVAVLLLASNTIGFALLEETATVEEDDVLLDRERRATDWQLYKPLQNPGCPKGTWEEELLDENNATVGFACHVCPEDSFVSMIGHYQNCVACNTSIAGTYPGTTIALYREKCVKKCDPGKSWDGVLTTTNRAGCTACPSGVYQDEYNFDINCKSCPMFHATTARLSTTIDNCTLTCPKGFEPTEDNSTCTQCKVGYLKTVKGNNMCEPCCGLTECLKNWTYVVGAQRRAECIKLTSPVQSCFSYLVMALERAASFIYLDETKETIVSLEQALCASGADMVLMREKTVECRDQTVVVGVGNYMMAVPRLQVNETLELDLAEVFAGDLAPDCTAPVEDSDTTAPTRPSSSIPKSGSTSTSSTSTTSTTDAPTTTPFY